MNKKLLTRNAIIGIALFSLWTFAKAIYKNVNKLSEPKQTEQKEESDGTEKMNREDAALINEENWHDAAKAYKVSGCFFKRLHAERQAPGEIATERTYQYYYHALQWLKRAAALGEPCAQVLFLEYAGTKLPPGVDYTPEEQEKYKANVFAALNTLPDKTSQQLYSLGICYEKGYGVEPNSEKAEQLKKEAILIREQTQGTTLPTKTPPTQ